MEVLYEGVASDRDIVDCIREGRRVVGDDIELLIEGHIPSAGPEAGPAVAVLNGANLEAMRVPEPCRLLLRTG